MRVLFRSEAAVEHQGAAFIDVISPCVAFNNHAGSTKSYDYIREHNEVLNRLDFMPQREPLTANYSPGEIKEIRQHDGQIIRLRKMSQDYDPHDRISAMNILQERAAEGEIVTGLIYLDTEAEDLHSNLNTVELPLNTLGEEELCPGGAALQAFNISLK